MERGERHLRQKRPPSLPSHCCSLILDPDTRKSPACEPRGLGFLLPCSSCVERDYEQCARRNNPLLAGSTCMQALHKTSAPKFTRYEDLVEAAQREERIFRRQPTPITWCISCHATRCREGCAMYEMEASAMRGQTPKAAPIEEGYSSSETVRAETREVLYSTPPPSRSK